MCSKWPTLMGTWGPNATRKSNLPPGGASPRLMSPRRLSFRVKARSYFDPIICYLYWAMYALSLAEYQNLPYIVKFSPMHSIKNLWNCQGKDKSGRPLFKTFSAPNPSQSAPALTWVFMSSQISLGSHEWYADTRVW